MMIIPIELQTRAGETPVIVGEVRVEKQNLEEAIRLNPEDWVLYPSCRVNEGSLPKLLGYFFAPRPAFPANAGSKTIDWAIQEIPTEETPFLLYKGVIVGRLYGGAPYSEMLEKLNS